MDTERKGSPASIERRLWLRTVVGPGDCFLWTGPVNRGGYGRISYLGRVLHIHRVAYALIKGEIPNGFEIDHLCRVRRCINPDHLEAVTPRVNILRGVGQSALNAKKTHCPKGHALVDGNLVLHFLKNGRQRTCLTCRRESAKRYAQRNTDLIRDYQKSYREKHRLTHRKAADAT